MNINQYHLKPKSLGAAKVTMKPQGFMNEGDCLALPAWDQRGAGRGPHSNAVNAAICHSEAPRAWQAVGTAAVPQCEVFELLLPRWVLLVGLGEPWVLRGIPMVGGIQQLPTSTPAA